MIVAIPISIKLSVSAIFLENSVSKIIDKTTLELMFLGKIGINGNIRIADL